MKKLIIFFLALTPLVMGSFTKLEIPKAAEPKKYALIIAIGDYNTAETGWAKISSKNDIAIMKSALVNIGFNSIDVLENENATRQGILDALKKIETKAATGDMITVHISSHGQQISDNNQPSDEIDGYDEAIVAYGAPVSNRKFKATRGATAKYDGSLHLRDEDLGSAINSIRAKVGKKGHVLLIVDACHSGTITRGSAIIRGGEAPFDLEGVEKPAKVEEDGGFGITGEGKTKTRGAGDNLGKFVLISGAAAEEVNYEYEDEKKVGYGSLSYCISKVLPTMPKGSSYRAFFAKLQAEMADKAPKQAPQLEGDVDNEMFGGSYIPQKKYFPVMAINSNKEIKISGGKLMGVSVGSTVVVEPLSTQTPNPKEKALSYGTVTEATQLDAIITLDKPIDAAKNKANYWVFVTSTAVQDSKIKVDVSNISDPEFQKAVAEAINKLGMAEIVDKGAELQIKEDATRSSTPTLSVLNLKYGFPINQSSYKSTDPKALLSITKDIQNYAQGKLFKELDEVSASYKVVITRFVPSSTKQIADTVKATLSRGNVLEIQTTDVKSEQPYVFIELKNQGDRVAYFNIIDIEPTGAINPIFPPTIVDANDRVTGVEPKEIFKLNPGQKKVFNYAVYIAPPYGVEIFKVIATDAPFDLTSTIMTRGEATRGAGLNAFQEKLGSSYDEGFTRGGGSGQQQSDAGTNTAEFTFKIVPKNK